MQADTDGNYMLAISLCGSLVEAVEARVNFLNGLKAEIESYAIPSAATTAVAASLTITNIAHANYHDFAIVVTNNSDQPISNWTLSFDYVGGTVYTVWVNGSSILLNRSGSRMTINPTNQWQPVYTIPAHSSITIIGNGGAAATGVANATFDGDAITMTFSRP